MVGPAGAIGGRTGVITSAADSLQIRLFGRGAHGSMPQASIDPVVMAAATVLRLQTIVSRELAATDAAVVTVGSLQAGTKENVIPDEAVIKLNVRTFDEGVRDARARRDRADRQRRGRGVGRAETAGDHAARPLLAGHQRSRRDAPRRRGVPSVFPGASGSAKRGRRPPARTSDRSAPQWHAPSVFWFVGGTDPEVYAKAKEAGRISELPTNHNPRFAPVLHPTLETGVATLVVASRAWLAKQADR